MDAIGPRVSPGQAGVAGTGLDVIPRAVPARPRRQQAGAHPGLQVACLVALFCCDAQTADAGEGGRGEPLAASAAGQVEERSAALTTSQPAALSAAPYVRQSGRYQAYVAGVRGGADSNQWTVTLKGVLPGSTLYVVGVWPNFYSLYPNMAVADGRNVYTELDRIDDTTLFATGIQGTESMGHWYAPAVAGGTYHINMSPSPATYEDYAALIVFEIAGTNAGVLDAHGVALARNVAPGLNALSLPITGSASNSLLVSVAFDEVSGNAPTVPVPGTSMKNIASLWNFLGSGLWSGRAASRALSAPGPTQAVFSAQENDPGYAPPNYLLSAAIFE